MEKNYDGSEKRKFKRILFSAKDEVIGVINFPGFADDLISYKIADIGAGGLRFIIPRDDYFKISTGDTFFLIEIKGKTKINFVANIELEVKWIMDHEVLEHVMIGCEFLNVAETVQQQIDQFVESELKQRYQEPME